jgi:VanZ family protein
VPGRAYFAWLVLGYVAFVVYGSLVPFHHEALTLDEALDRFRALPYYHLGLTSRADLIANFLLYIPLAYLGMAALAVDRTPWADLPAALVVLPLCVVLSVGIEFVQLYFPGRTTSLNDVYAESVGAVAGVGLWATAGRRVTDWVREVRSRTAGRGLAAQLLPAYLIVLLIAQAMPLDLTISPRELYEKYREGRVGLVPFGQASGWSVLANVAAFMPIGLLASQLPGPAWQGQRGWWSALLLGLGTAVVVEGAQLVVYTRVFEPGDIPTGALAVLAGYAVVRILEHFRPGSSRRTLWGEIVGAASGPRRRLVQGALLSAWLVGAVVFSWEPFDFDATPEAIARKLEAVSLVPFADYYAGSEFSAFSQVLLKGIFFAGLGAVLVLGGEPAELATVVLVALAGMGVAFGLEVGQMFLPDHVPSLSDVLVAGAGAAAGAVVMSRIQDALGMDAVLEGRPRELCR